VALMRMAQGAVAQTGAAAPTCNGPNGELPDTLAGRVKTPVPISTAHDSAETLQQQCAARTANRLILANTEAIKFAHQPTEQMPKQYVYSGMISFRVLKDRTYSVMISEGELDRCRAERTANPIAGHAGTRALRQIWQENRFPAQSRRRNRAILRSPVRNHRRSDRACAIAA